MVRQKSWKDRVSTATTEHEKRQDNRESKKLRNVTSKAEQRASGLTEAIRKPSVNGAKDDSIDKVKLQETIEEEIRFRNMQNQQN